MPKILYSDNIVSKTNNPLPFPNYLNSLSLLTDSSISTVRAFFNANKSISEALLITLINVIQEGIAYQLANHSNISYDNNSKSYNNTNFYCCKGVPIKPKTLKKRSNSFSYSSSSYKNESEFIIKDNEGSSLIKRNGLNNKLSRSYSSPKLCTENSSKSQYTSGSRLKYSINLDNQNSNGTTNNLDNSSIELPIPNNGNSTNNDIKQDNQSFSSTINSEKQRKLPNDYDSKNSFSFNTTKGKSNKMNVFILLKNLLSILDIFKSLNNPSSSNNHHKPLKPFNSVESLNDKEKWEEFGRIYNETMYNLKAEEYHKSKSQIFKYSTGLNSVQGIYYDEDNNDNNDDNDFSAMNSMSFLDEKIRKNSENKMTDILSRIKKDTLTFAEIKECGEYMRRVGIYQFFIQCPINHLLRVIASKLFSCGEKKYSPILRFLFVTCVISPIQISINILCLALSNKKTPSEIKKCFTDNFSHILKLSLIYVPFSTQYIARAFLPSHLRVPFFNLSSFILGTYIKLIMKKKDDKKVIHF